MWLRCPYPGDGEALYQGVAETLQQLRAWPDSLPWAQKPQSVEASEDYCQTCYAAWAMRISWPMLMIDKASAGFVGSIGFHQINVKTQQWELGYWCRSSFQGQGRMTEAVQVLTQAALQVAPNAQLVCRIDSRNHASAKVVLTAGYKMVKEETVSSDAGALRLAARLAHRAIGLTLQAHLSPTQFAPVHHLQTTCQGCAQAGQ
jgi:RimJ/RimL family protein N-acetyltransferase